MRLNKCNYGSAVMYAAGFYSYQRGDNDGMTDFIPVLELISNPYPPLINVASFTLPLFRADAEIYRVFLR